MYERTGLCLPHFTGTKQPSHIESLSQLFNAAEKLRYDQYHSHAARLFLISVLMKSVLSDKLGILPHEVIIIQLQPNGKPFVRGNKAIYFNLSHSADFYRLCCDRKRRNRSRC